MPAHRCHTPAHLRAAPSRLRYLLLTIVLSTLVACSNSGQEVFLTLNLESPSPASARVVAGAEQVLQFRPELLAIVRNEQIDEGASDTSGGVACLPAQGGVEGITVMASNCSANLMGRESMARVRPVVDVTIADNTAPGRYRLLVPVQLCPSNFEDFDSSEDCLTRNYEIDLLVEAPAAAVPPAAPTGFIGMREAGGARLTWTEGAGTTGYRLERAVGDGAFTTIATLTAPASAYLDTTADPASRLQYRLTPVNARGDGTPAMTTLAPVAGDEVALTVYVQGTGTVTSMPAGITCSGIDACIARFPAATVVTLVPAPGAGQRFDRWEGDPDCADGMVTLTGAPTCVANFVSTSAAWRAPDGALNRSPLTAGAFIDTPELRTTADGSVVAAWVEDERLYVRLADGSVSEPAPGVTVRGGAALELDAEGNPVVAFSRIGPSELPELHVRRRVSGAWQALGTALNDATLTDATMPALARIDDVLAVAWTERDLMGNTRIHVRRFDGSTWVPAAMQDGPAVDAGEPARERPRLTATGNAGSRSLAVAWSENGSRLHVAELLGGNWVPTGSEPYSTPLRATLADIAWFPGVGLVVASAPASSASLVVRRWNNGAWEDLGTPRGDPATRSFLIAVAFSHGAADEQPLLGYVQDRASGAVQEALVERYAGVAWVAVGEALPERDRHGENTSPRGLAIANAAIPRALLVLQGRVPGTIASDVSLLLNRFE